MREKFKYFFISLRPFQWYKNLLVFVLLIFSGNLFKGDALLLSILVFLSFSVTSGWVYIFNDICDQKSDRVHPIKKNRPIAAGKISPGFCITLATIILFGALGLSSLISFTFVLILLLYIVLNLLYSLIFKHIFIVDIVLIALGFVLRVVAGFIITDSSISFWLLVCTFFLSIFLIAGKRRNELTFLKGNGTKNQVIVSKYNLKNLDLLISAFLFATIITYVLFAIDGNTIHIYGTENLIFSLPFVFYGLLRYFRLIKIKKEMYVSEIAIFKDKRIIFNNFLWLLAIVWVIYL